MIVALSTAAVALAEMPQMPLIVKLRVVWAEMAGAKAGWRVSATRQGVMEKKRKGPSASAGAPASSRRANVNAERRTTAAATVILGTSLGTGERSARNGSRGRLVYMIPPETDTSQLFTA